MNTKRSLSEIIAEKKATILAKQQQEKEDKELLEALFETPVEKPFSITTDQSEPLNPTVLSTSLKDRLFLIRQKKDSLLTEALHPEGISTDNFVNFIPSNSSFAQIKADSYNASTEGAFSLNLPLNKDQLLAEEMALAGQSFCLIGAAGTGKTATQTRIAASLLKNSESSLGTHYFRIQGTGERVQAPSIAFIAYTRIASGNLKRAVHKDPLLKASLTHNITTFHNLCEYSPETYWDYETNSEKFRFLPHRNQSNPLDITHLVIEEASMLGLDHWDVLYKAMRCGVQIIFIGDINQLPPVFGDSILNYALMQLPIVELTHVYRQSGDSTILENAHNILAGKELVKADDFQIVTSGQINHTQAKLAISYGSLTFPKWMDMGVYDPETDIILSPWNVRDLGTINLNNWIAQSLGQRRKAIVHEVLAGRNKKYLAEGDKILYNKRVGVIVDIKPNIAYMGKRARTASVNLNRFGIYTGTEGQEIDEDLDSLDYTNLDLDKMLLAANEESEEKGDAVKASSHIVKLLLEEGEEVTLSSVGAFDDAVFSLGYALTIHKAQGCEWRKVFIFLHRDQNVSLCRELLYTAVTRAREGIVIISKEDVINRAIATQRIKGNTLKEKIEYFNSSMKNLNNSVSCTK